MITSLSNGRFSKGESGNPYGLSVVARKWGAEIRKHTMYGQEMMDYLLGNLRDPKCNELIRFKSVEMLIRYGVGEPVPADSESNELVSLTNEELATVKSIYERAVRRGRREVDRGAAKAGEPVKPDSAGQSGASVDGIV